MRLPGARSGPKLKSLPQFNLNSRAYRSGRTLLAFELSSYLTTKRLFRTRLDNKSYYIDKSLTNNIKSQFNSKQWISTKQKKLLIEHVEKCQINLSVLTTTINRGSTSKIFYIMELLLNSLLFQVYAVEILSANKGSKSPGIDSRILLNTPQSKLKLLQELKNFRKRKTLPLKRIYIPKKKQTISIPCITDRLSQQLFVLVLDPVIEANSDTHSYGFRKGRSPVMAIGDVQKNLQSKARKGSPNLESLWIWDAAIKKCFDSINHDWFLKNVPLPPKYLYILKNWLRLDYIEFGNINVSSSDSGIPQGGIISPLLMNFTLNGIEKLIKREIVNYSRIVSRSRLKKKSSDNDITLQFYCKLSDGSFKERQISCKFFRYANDFLVICSSDRLLALIKSGISKFLQQRGLMIHPNKSRTILFNVNTPFNFLGYTFVYLIRTRHIRNKTLHTNTPEYRLEGRPRLFVYPSKTAVKSFKICLKILIKQNQNISAYRLIALLNPKIRGWVNYYSFSNSHGVLRSLRKWIYTRVTIWMKRKYPKSSRIWLNKHYFLITNLLEEHDLAKTPEIVEYIAKLTSLNQVQQNKWNFYGIVHKSAGAEEYSYKVPRINVMLWPDSIKNIKVATAFVPNKKLLSFSYYLNRNKWVNERKKRESLHTDKESKLFSSLLKRDQGLCFLCETSLADELTSFENSIEIHHIVPFTEGGSNKKKI